MADELNIHSETIKLQEDAPLYGLVQDNIRLLVLGEPSVGKTTLISTCINNSLEHLQKLSSFTLQFHTSIASITEIAGLHTFNKNRGEIWKSIMGFVQLHKINIIWFCIQTDFLESTDELWHWVSLLSQVCHVILVRTKCLNPGALANLQTDATRISAKLRTPKRNLDLQVLGVLANDISLNPRGGGGIVEAHGIEELVRASEDLLRVRVHVESGVFQKLMKQVKSDADRYASEEAQKGVMVNALRSLSSSDHNNSKSDDEFTLLPKDDESNPDEGFVVLPRENSENHQGVFSQVFSSSKARTVLGVLVAFAVIRLISMQSSI